MSIIDITPQQKKVIELPAGVTISSLLQRIAELETDFVSGISQEITPAQLLAGFSTTISDQKYFSFYTNLTSSESAGQTYTAFSSWHGQAIVHTIKNTHSATITVTLGSFVNLHAKETSWDVPAGQMLKLLFDKTGSNISCLSINEIPAI